MKRWIKTAVAGVVALAPIAALAAIDNTHHDMIQQLGSTEKCAYCHSKTLASTTVTATFGAVGNFCVLVCHQGGGALANALPNSSGYFTDTFATTGAVADATIVAFSGGTYPTHGAAPTAIPAPDAAADVGNTNWPHSSATANMQCTTCHAVHDGTNPPFLNAPLSHATAAQSFCIKCHNGAGRWNTLATAGAHPAEIAWDVTAAAARNTAKASDAATMQRGRALNLKAALITANPGVATVAAFNANGIHWATGGHIVNQGAAGLPVTAATANGANTYMVGCYSCHSAHQPVNMSVTGSPATPLTIAPMAHSAVVPATASVICAGCHGAAAANATAVQNPGTTTGYHPVNVGTTGNYAHRHADHGAVAGNPNIPLSGSFPIPMSAAMSNANMPKGTNGQLVCASCHDVHGGVTGLMAIRQVGSLAGGTATSTTQSVCLGCHTASTTVSGANSHHPGQAIDYTGAGGGVFANTAWTTADGLGRLSDGLSCPDCHVFQGKQGAAPYRSTAHNWN